MMNTQPQTSPGLLWINAPHFCAGADLDSGVVNGAIAPIIRYMRGWPIERVRSYCRSKQWELWECGVDLANPLESRRPQKNFYAGDLMGSAESLASLSAALLDSS
jgi:hypothetical protein